MELVNCNLCGSKKYNLVLKINSYDIVKCRKCSLVYLNPRPTAKELALMYHQEYFLKEVKQYTDNQEAVNEQIEKVQLVQKHLKKGKILDIGCGEGYFLANAKKYGYETYGVEISNWAAENAKNKFNLQIFCGDFLQVNLKEKNFDAITMWHNFEHHQNPVGSLKKIKTILKDKGVLIIVSPNVDSFDRKIYRNKWEAWRVPHHFYHFSPVTIKKMLSFCGFKVINIEYRMSSILIKSLKIKSQEIKYKEDIELKINKNNSLIKNTRHYVGKIIRKLLPGRDMTVVACKLK